MIRGICLTTLALGIKELKLIVSPIPTNIGPIHPYERPIISAYVHEAPASRGPSAEKEEDIPIKYLSFS